MSTLDGWDGWDGWNGWDGWDGWDGWNAAGASSGGRKSSGGNLSLALTRTREALVYGPPIGVRRPAGWPGTHANDALKGLSSSIRVQLATMDVISAIRVLATTDGVNVEDSLIMQPKYLPIERPSEQKFQDELAAVEAKATLRTERAAEIFAQLSFNPAFYATILPLNPRTTPYTLETITATVAIASFVVQRCKAIFNLPRPSELSPRIQPMLALPPYSAFPSGHATECHLVAAILTRLLRDSTPETPAPSDDRMLWINKTEVMLQGLAHRIADNRVVAGIHFPLDGVAGLKLAEFLLDTLVEASSKTPSASGNVFAWLWQQAVLEWT